MDNYPLPPLNAVRAFEAAARCGSFVAAADDLHVTHWAIGKQVRLLEDWLGMPLFERRGRGVVLTDEGAELLADVGEAFGRLSQAAGKLRKPDIARRVSGTVRVSVLSSFALRWLFPRLAGFQELFPKIDLRISTTSRKLRYVGTAFDFGIRSNPETSIGFRSVKLMPDLRRPACSPAVLRKYPIETVHDLSRHTLLHASTTRSAWPDYLTLAGVPDLTAFRNLELDHVFLQIQAAVDGLGVALASVPLVEADVAAGRLVFPIAGPAWHAGTYELVVREDRAEDAATRAFETWIITTARNDAGSPLQAGRQLKE
jgi:LysR family transcriptional regulator, glycine cleavage system transcriptional activator